MPRRPKNEVRYDAQPLLALYVDLDTAAAVFGVTTRTLDRWMKNGLAWEMADVMANKAGFHPATLWGWEWFAPALTDVEPEQLSIDEQLAVALKDLSRALISEGAP